MKRVLGLDLGSRTCGVAISDPLGMIARAVETLRFDEDDYETAAKEVAKIISAEQVTEVVLGMPKHMNGDVGVRGEVSLKFKEILSEKTSVPITLWDERLTTVAAEKLLISADVSRKKRKLVIDQLAAVQILQGYLDRR